MRGTARSPEVSPADRLCALIVVMAAGLAGWVWTAAELTGWSAGGRWPHLDLNRLAVLLAGLPSHLDDPARAWPPRDSPCVLPPAAFYTWVGLEGLMAGAGAAVSLRLRDRRQGGRHGLGAARTGQGGRWARRGDLRHLAVGSSGGKGRLVLGRRTGAFTSRRLVATEAGHSVLAIGPTQSGKTSSLAIPALLQWRGPVVATSVKDDLAALTRGWRSSRGPCQVFDPTASSGLSPVARWSPLSGCASWADAQRMAAWLVEATPGRRGMADAAFWYSTAAKQLAPLLLAARAAGAGIREVVRWTNAGEFDEPTALLEMSGEDDAALSLSACAARDDRIRSSVVTTLETVLAPFEDPVVAASTSVSDIDVAGLLAGGGTLYLCGPSHEQARVQGLFAALVSMVVAEAFRLASERGAGLDPPLLLVLDEVANIAPIRDLDTLASTGAGLGIQLVTVCQDLAQLAARYDADRARTIANNHRAKVLLSAVSDLATLDLVSGLAGEQAIKETSITEDLRDGRRTRSTTTAMRRMAPADVLRRTPPGQGVLLYGHLPPVRLTLRPWFADRELRRRALRSSDP